MSCKVIHRAVTQILPYDFYWNTTCIRIRLILEYLRYIEYNINLRNSFYDASLEEFIYTLHHVSQKCPIHLKFFNGRCQVASNQFQNYSRIPNNRKKRFVFNVKKIYARFFFVFGYFCH